MSINKKIAIISEREPGGIGTYSIELVNALKGIGVNSENLFIDKKEIKDSLMRIAKKCKNYNLVHIQHDYNEFGKGSLLFAQFLRELKKNYSGRLIITMHTVRSLRENLGKLSRIKKIIFKIMNNKIKKNFDLILVHTNSSKEILVKQYGFPENKVKIIPMWTPEIKNPKNNSLIAKLKSEGKKIVLCWGFISPHKNYEAVIRGIAKTPGEVVLIIAGSPHPNSFNRDKEYLNFLKELSQKMDLGKRVIFVDKFFKQKEIDSLIGSSDLVVLPYKTITTSAVFYRSLALKRLILASKIAFFKEINKKYGYPGLFASERDIPTEILNILNNKKLKRKLNSGIKKCLDSSKLKSITWVYSKIYSELSV